MGSFSILIDRGPAAHAEKRREVVQHHTSYHSPACLSRISMLGFAHMCQIG
jgi:hypothetical protein